MFERILSITKNFAIVKVSSNIGDDILNYNVILEDKEKKILGEIDEIVNSEAKISFLGEFINDRFYSGIIRRPSLDANIRIINKQELGELVGDNDSRTMILGVSPLYNNYPIKVNINEMFSNHMAIFGNTGSGKTCGVARIVQNLFNMKDKIPFNSNIFIFNNTSEYDSAFRDINKINNNFNYKLYTTDKSDPNGNQIKIPLWIMDVDDYANLLDVTEYFQINIIEKMLSLVSVFARNDEESTRYKNHLIAKAIISVLYSNQVAAKIRDQIFNILQDCYTNELNLDAEVPGIGYTREFRKCFDIDNHGEFVERILVTKYVQSFIDNNTKWNEDYVPIYFTLDQLEVALNFALISEGLLLNDKSYSEAIALKVKLHTINNSSSKEFFNVPSFITVEQFINSMLINQNNGRVQIVNFVLEEIDDRLAKAMVKIFSRILFKFSKKLQPRGAMPIHIMLEEAHRYVQRDKDIDILGYNIFERIAKEGRKFGVILDLITQRPTELSETVLSQCSNFIIFKLNHPTDLEYIRKMVPNISSDVIEKQKSLQSGTCVAFGRMMRIPMIVKMQMPNPEPQSSNASIYDKWIVEWKN
ncbi:MAG: ATP-binding protein [Bacilli bacterium]